MHYVVLNDARTGGATLVASDTYDEILAHKPIVASARGALATAASGNANLNVEGVRKSLAASATPDELRGHFDSSSVIQETVR